MVAIKSPIQLSQAKALVLDFFKEFQNLCNHQNAQSSALEKCLDPSFELVLNGRHICKNLINYSHFIDKIRKSYSSLEIHGPNETPILADQQIVIQYDVNVSPRTGAKRGLRMMAIATIDKNKIAKWEQVSHEKK